MNVGNISIYACGGAGINIGKALEERKGSFNSPAFAKREVYYIDTSKANLSKVESENVYLYEDVDGAGKVRRHVSETVMESVKNVLVRFKPADVSIVVSSTSGGSGSVIAPTLVSELLARKLPVIYIGVSSSDSKLEIKNNLDTIRSFAKIASIRKRPVVGTLYENSTNQVEVNQRVVSEIIMLMALFSKNNEGMDSQDLQNWLNFSSVTEYQPSFAHLNVQVGDVTKSKDHHLISAAILSPDRESHQSLGFEVEYQTVGYFDLEQAGGELNRESVKYLIYTGPMEALFKKQEALYERMNEEASARIVKSSILESVDDSEDNGLVF